MKKYDLRKEKDFREVIPHTKSRFSESHMTAPETNIEYIKEDSNITIPPLSDVEDT